MTQFLLFRLGGPMASWGEIAVGELRPSEIVPTRSALCGLLGAALGWTREHETELLALNRDLAFAVRLDRLGRRNTDFHTVRLPKPPSKRGKQKVKENEDEEDSQNALLTRRDYREDANYTVAIWHAGQFLLSDLRQALLAPVFCLYLGRKSCPLALPLAPELKDCDTLVQALESYPFPPPELSFLGFPELRSGRSGRSTLDHDQAHDLGQEGKRGTRLFWSPADSAGPLIGIKPDRIRSKRGRLISALRRRFDLDQLAEGILPQAPSAVEVSP